MQLNLKIDAGLQKGYSPDAVSLFANTSKEKVAKRLVGNLSHQQKLKQKLEAWYCEVTKEKPTDTLFKIWMDFRDCKLLLKEWLFSDDERKQSMAVKYLNSYMNSEKIAAEAYFAKRAEEQNVIELKASAPAQGLSYFKQLLYGND